VNYFKNENINVEYGFTFLIHFDRKNMIVIVQSVHLTMFSPNKHKTTSTTKYKQNENNIDEGGA
jgi:hypothetical protein